MSNELDRICPACGAGVGELCHTVIDGEETHWTHDARILAEIVADIRQACRTCGTSVADPEAAATGAARYDDTQGGHNDRHTLVVEAAERAALETADE